MGPEAGAGLRLLALGLPVLLGACIAGAPPPAVSLPRSSPIAAATGTVGANMPASCHARGPLPDPACTPGALDPRVTQDDLATTICRTGYTATVRPPGSYTNPLKLEQMALYGEAGPPSEYEEDHLVPLELGGHPTDPRNLWPEPGASPNQKDRVENRLHALVCAGSVTLAQAQAAIASDWTTAESAVAPGG